MQWGQLYHKRAVLEMHHCTAAKAVLRDSEPSLLAALHVDIQREVRRLLPPSLQQQPPHLVQK